MIVGGLALLVVMLTGAWLSRALLGPLRELTAGVTRFAAGDYGAKVAVRTRDEIGQLCSAFNGMVDELRGKNVVIENKNRENEELLLNVLPAPIANRLRGGEQRHRRRLRRGHGRLRRPRRLHGHVVGDAAADVVTLLNGLFTPLRRGRARSRHREDQDGGRRLHGGVRPARCRWPTTPSAWCAWRSAWSTSPASTPWSITFR